MKNNTKLAIKNLEIRIKTKDKYIYPINGLDLDIYQGETLALLGESGCGKTMTANAIMRLLPHNSYYTKSSEIILDNFDILNYSEIQMQNIRGNNIAMIFQDPMTALNPVYTIGDQLLEVLRLRIKNDGSKKSLIKKAILLLNEVGLTAPEQQYYYYPHQLSGGMRQRVMIAMALAAKPSLLLADEPTTALDVTIQKQILELLKKIQLKYNMSLLLITHDLGVVTNIADRVAVMYAGHVVEVAKTFDLLNNPKHPYTKMLLESQPNYSKRTEELAVISGSVPRLDQEFTLCRFKDRCPVAGIRCSQEKPNLESGKIDNRDGHEYRCFYPDNKLKLNINKNNINLLANNEKTEVKNALVVDELNVSYPVYSKFLRRVVNQVKIVQDVSFAIKSGSTLALVGESGSGKTTVAKAIMGLIKSSGKINYGDNLIQIIFQDPYSALNPKMMILDILQEGYYSIYKKHLSRDKLIELLNSVNLPENSLYKYPHEFSGGQRQRIAIARALATKPKILILDESTSALDVSVQAQILNLLKNLQRKYNLTYLFITHNLGIVGYFADYIAVMYLGRIVEYGPVEQIIKKPMHPYSRSLLNSVATMHNNLEIEQNINNEMPSLAKRPTGCYFSNRCPKAMSRCISAQPKIINLSSEHWVSCFLYDN